MLILQNNQTKLRGSANRNLATESHERNRERTTFVLIGALTFAAAGWCRAAVTVQDPGTYVVDRAGVLDPRHNAFLETRLRELDQKTTAQVKLLTVSETEGEDVFTFGHRHAERWKLGRQGKDNGVLIVFVPKSERQKGDIRIHTGYGLESVLPDSWCGTIQRETVDRYFRDNRYSEGLVALATAVSDRVAEAAGATLSGARAPVGGKTRSKRYVKPGVFCSAGVVPLVILLIVFSSLSRRRRYHRSWGGNLARDMLWATILSNMLGGGGRRGGWGGGSGGGGFGGGFFGGGGRFGGGGSGASW